MKRVVKTSLAGFGAALAANYASPDLQAGVVGITFNPGQASWTSGSNLRSVTAKTTGSGAAPVGGFSAWNDSAGKSFSFNGRFASWAVAAKDEVLNTSNFSGITSGIKFTTDATGTVYFGFRATSANGGGVGWFAADLGGKQGDIIYGGALVGYDGQYGKEGVSVTVGAENNSGGGVIPEPSTLAMATLALGAAGLHRRRKAAA